MDGQPMELDIRPWDDFGAFCLDDDERLNYARMLDEAVAACDGGRFDRAKALIENVRDNLRLDAGEAV